MARGAQRDPRKERFWRRMLRRWRRARGLTVRAFCAQHGLSEPAFYFWRRTLAQRDGDQANQHITSPTTPTPPPPCGPAKLPLFVPLAVTAAAPHATTEPHATLPPAASLELVLRQGRRIRVPVGFDPATLQQLLALLEPPCPEPPSC